MDPLQLLILVAAGLAAGFVAGLIGVGGGVIFAPILFFYYQAVGVPETVIAPLTIGSSLFCTLVAAVVSAWTQYSRKSVHTRVALQVGAFSALAILLMTRFVTTQPWYDGTDFQIVFSAVLLIVVVRMVIRPSEREVDDARDGGRRFGWPLLAGTGGAAGVVAAAAGVGGGVVLVPVYSHLLRLPIHRAAGTSSATIVLIAAVGVVTYAWIGWNEPLPHTAVGYVDAVRSLLLSIPAIFTAHLGVSAAHRINRRALRLSFAGIAVVVAVRLLWRALW